MLNYFFVFLIITSGVFYVYFKFRQFRTTYVLPIRKQMYSSMAGASLGALLLFFGLNQIVIFDKLIVYVIAAIFIPLGLYVLVFNFRAYRHYIQFVKEEAKINNF